MTDKTITQQFEDIKEAICDHYCKMPQEYLAMHRDPDDAQEQMLKEQCKRCPLGRL